MNIFKRTTLSTMKAARSRTIVTVIGVALSACLFTAVTTAIFSGYESFRKYFMSEIGDYHIRIHDTDSIYYDEMLEDKNVEYISRLNEVGYGKVNLDYSIYGMDPVEAEGLKPRMYVYSYNDDTDDYMGIRVSEGKKPTNSNEIIISKKMACELGDSGQVGDCISISLVNIDKNVEKTEDFVTNSTVRNYKIVGIYTRENFLYLKESGNYGITYYDEGVKPKESEIFVKLNVKKYDKNTFLDKYNLNADNAKINKKWYSFYGLSRYKTLGIIVVVLNSVYFVIFLATTIMISSTFSISYNERIKQLGLIKSLGATKRQLRKMIRIEANYVALMGVPIGMLLGIIVMKLCINIFTNVANANNYYEQAYMNGFELKYIVSLESLVFSLIFILITIHVASLATLFRISKMNAIDAIRQSNEIKIKPRKLRVGRIFSKFASLDRFMAKKYFKAGKKKYRVTIISLAISMVIVVSMYVSYNYMLTMFQNMLKANDYDVRINVMEMLNSSSSMSLYTYSKAKNGIKEIKGVENVSIYAYDDVGLPSCSVSKSILTDKAKENLVIIEDEEGSKNSEKAELMVSNLFVDEDTYMNIITEAGLDYIKYTSNPNPPPILYNVFNDIPIQDDKYIVNNVFKEPVYELELVHSEGEENIETLPHSIIIGDMINKKLPGLDVYSASQLYLIYPDYVAENVMNYMVAFDVNNYDLMKTDFDNWKKANNINSIAEDSLQSVKVIESSKGISSFASTGFIFLVILIAIANVFNTITANILVRKRDFAVLQSIGMGNKVINKMLVYECITYGTKAIILGIILSGFSVSSVAYLEYMYNKDNLTSNILLNVAICLKNAIPWKIVGLSILVTYIVVFISAFYALSRVKKNNIIETLKNDLV